MCESAVGTARRRSHPEGLPTEEPFERRQADDEEWLVLCHDLILGSTDFSLQRASSIFICQSTPRCAALISLDQARFLHARSYS